MKTLVAAVFGLAVAVSVNVATAYVAEVTTTIPMTSIATAQNTTELGAVVQSAIRDVLDHAIAFTPIVVTLEAATVVGDLLYLRLLVADEDGRSALEALSKEHEPEADPDSEFGREHSSGISL